MLNCWILQWGADHLLRFLAGDFGAFRGYFNANIFYPEPLTLAYSEHLTAQVLQILPVYALTGNIVLCYNLLFLSTFVLSGLGTYLLVRELTGARAPAFVAGLLYGFAPYRIGQFSHLQVLSSQWMPFALYGVRRYFDTRRAWPLAGAAAGAGGAELVVRLLPAVLRAVRGRVRALRDRGPRALEGPADLGVAGRGSGGCRGRHGALPAALPGAAAASGSARGPSGRSARYSADIYSYLTAHEGQSFWGAIMRAYVKPEGELFPSVIPVLLALAGVAAHARITLAVTRSRGADPGMPAWRRVVIGAAAAVLAWQMASVLIVLARTGFDWQIGPLSIRVHDLARALRALVLAAGALVVFSRRARAFLRGIPRSAFAFYIGALAAAFWLSLGPIITTKGVRVAGDGLYWWFYQYVPGFDGLRVPARMAMIFALALAVIGGYGARAIERSLPALRRPARGRQPPLPGGGLAGAHHDERHVERRRSEAAAGAAHRTRAARPPSTGLCARCPRRP